VQSLIISSCYLRGKPSVECPEGIKLILSWRQRRLGEGIPGLPYFEYGPAVRTQYSPGFDPALSEPTEKRATFSRVLFSEQQTASHFAQGDNVGLLRFR
jgi:hypothetical protein